MFLKPHISKVTHVPQSGRQPAVGMTHELKQSIKDSAELIRNINGDFSRLGEKLNDWIPVVDKKVITKPYIAS